MITRSYLAPLICSLALTLSACDTTDPESSRPGNVTLTAAEQRIIEADNAFGISLFAAMHEQEPEKNVVVSPLSISMALGMALNGADEETRQEMIEVLKKSSLSEQEINESYKSLLRLLTGLDEYVDLDIANSIWYRDGFAVQRTFLETNKDYFHAEVQPADFNNPQTVEDINNWVSANTNGLINKIIERIEPETLLYLINAMYFKATWTYQFDPDYTEDAPFTNFDGTSSTVPLMSMQSILRYSTTDLAAYVDLPYGDSLYAMTIVLPHEPDNIDAVISDIENMGLPKHNNDAYYTPVDIYLPRFTSEYNAPLKTVLQLLGMQRAFSPQDANFSRISDTRDLHISQAIHKTFIEVSEEGTEAAAVTAIGIGTTSVGEDVIPVVRVDKSFLFFIRELSTGTHLFSGKILTL